MSAELLKLTDLDISVVPGSTAAQSPEAERGRAEALAQVIMLDHNIDTH